MVVSLTGKRVYLDTNTIIYALEGIPAYANLKAGLLDHLDKGNVTVVTSELTLVETIVGTRNLGSRANEAVFRTFLTPSANFVLEPISMAVLETVIDLRSQFRFKIPDAIHLATGILAGCDAFVTNDSDWSKAGVTVIDPSAVG